MSYSRAEALWRGTLYEDLGHDKAPHREHERGYAHDNEVGALECHCPTVGERG
jgi:hypothetical protein